MVSVALYCPLRIFLQHSNIRPIFCFFFGGGRLFVKRFALYYQTVVCLSVLSCPVCHVGVLWPTGWTDEDETTRR